MLKELKRRPTDGLDYITRILAFTPLLWICLGIYIGAAFFISTGVWPDHVTSLNPVKFPAHLRPAFHAFQLMFVTSFMYLPAIFILIGLNFIVALKNWRLFLFFWAPMFIISCVLAFYFAVFFFGIFESYT
jgi:hypothetical protein